MDAFQALLVRFEELAIAHGLDRGQRLEKSSEHAKEIRELREELSAAQAEVERLQKVIEFRKSDTQEEIEIFHKIGRLRSMQLFVEKRDPDDTEWQFWLHVNGNVTQAREALREQRLAHHDSPRKFRIAFAETTWSDAVAE